MSANASTLVRKIWDRAPQEGIDLLLLLAVAFEGDETGRAVVSLPQLAHRTRTSVRAVQRRLLRLHVSGLIVVDAVASLRAGSLTTDGPAVTVQEGSLPHTLPSLAFRRLAEGAEFFGVGSISGMRRILASLSDRPDGLTRTSIMVRCGLMASSGASDRILAEARDRGFVAIHGDRRELRRLTGKGRAFLGKHPAPPTPAEVLAHWLKVLEEPARAILLLAVQHHPAGVSLKDLEASDGAAAVAVHGRRLRALGLVHEIRGSFYVSRELV